MPGEPVCDDAAGLRAANARLRAVVEAKDAQVAALTAALEASLERERRLELRLAEVERRLNMDSSDSGTPCRRSGSGERGQACAAAVRAGAQQGPQKGRSARSPGQRTETGSGPGREEGRAAAGGVPVLPGAAGRRGVR